MKGAEFIIDLPLASEESAGVEKTHTPPDFSSLEVRARILLIEDHADTLSTLSRLLEKRGHTVVGAKNGEVARKIFATEEFDVIVSDLGLPDCSGLELITEFRTRRTTPAIALSGYGMESDVRNCIVAGFNEHLTKPIDFAQLLQTITRLAARR